jgi:hypothetical protein
VALDKAHPSRRSAEWISYSVTCLNAAESLKNAIKELVGLRNRAVFQEKGGSVSETQKAYGNIQLSATPSDVIMRRQSPSPFSSFRR